MGASFLEVRWQAAESTRNRELAIQISMGRESCNAEIDIIA